MGRRYFNKGKTYQFRDYFSPVDFSCERYFNATPASRQESIQSNDGSCAAVGRRAAALVTYLFALDATRRRTS